MLSKTNVAREGNNTVREDHGETSEARAAQGPELSKTDSRSASSKADALDLSSHTANFIKTIYKTSTRRPPQATAKKHALD